MRFVDLFDHVCPGRFCSAGTLEEPLLADRTHLSAFAAVRRQLDAYFGGTLRRFDIPLAPRGTEFQLAVWEALTHIPYGETITYSDLAIRIGNPAAVRAVGAANGANPIPIVVPCHRVIGADGSLTGFGGGLPAKRALLELEGAPCVAPSSQLGLL